MTEGLATKCTRVARVSTTLFGAPQRTGYFTWRLAASGPKHVFQHTCIPGVVADVLPYAIHRGNTVSGSAHRLLQFTGRGIKHKEYSFCHYRAHDLSWLR